jgi:hypothetical protein
MAQQDQRQQRRVPQAPKEENLLEKPAGVFTGLMHGAVEDIVRKAGGAVGSDPRLQAAKSYIDRTVGIKGVTALGAGVLSDVLESLGLYDGIKYPVGDVVDAFLEEVGKAKGTGQLTQSQFDVAKNKAMELAAAVANMRRQFPDALIAFIRIEAQEFRSSPLPSARSVAPSRFRPKTAGRVRTSVVSAANAGEILQHLLRTMTPEERDQFGLYEPALYEPERIMLLRYALQPGATVADLLKELQATFGQRKQVESSPEVRELKDDLAKTLKGITGGFTRLVRRFADDPGSLMRALKKEARRRLRKDIKGIRKDRQRVEELGNQRAPTATALFVLGLVAFGFFRTFCGQHAWWWYPGAAIIAVAWVLYLFFHFRAVSAAKRASQKPLPKSPLRFDSVTVSGREDQSCSPDPDASSTPESC